MATSLKKTEKSAITQADLDTGRPRTNGYHRQRYLAPNSDEDDGGTGTSRQRKEREDEVATAGNAEGRTRAADHGGGGPWRSDGWQVTKRHVSSEACVGVYNNVADRVCSYRRYRPAGRLTDRPVWRAGRLVVVVEQLVEELVKRTVREELVDEGIWIVLDDNVRRRRVFRLGLSDT